MPRFRLLVSLVIIPLAAGCFVDALGVAGSGGSTGDGGADPAGVASSSSAGSVASSGGGPATSSASATTAMSSSSSGQTPICGNDIIEAGEQCDSSNPNHPHCSACAVVCDGPYEVLDPTTFHCYSDADDDVVHTSWGDGRALCWLWGGDLVVINDPAELAFVRSVAANGGSEDRWIGATDGLIEDLFVWVDPTVPFNYPFFQDPWESDEPQGGPNDDCVIMEADGQLDEIGCNDSGIHPMCERAPVGQ